MTRTLGIAAFEFRQPLEQALARVRELGAQYCEIATPTDVTPDTADRVAELAEKHGVKVTGVCSLTKLNTTDDVSGTLKIIIDSIVCAGKLGAPFAITYFGGHPDRTVGEAINRYKELVQPCLEQAEKQGVTLLVENHFSHAPGEATNTADGCLELIETIGSRWFGLNFDPCNFSIGAEEYFPYAYKRLKPYIRNVHMKDAIKYVEMVHGLYHGRIVHDLRQGAFIFVPMGAGAVNNDVVLKALVADGYSGPVTIEAHTPEETLDDLFRTGLQYCRQRGI